MAFNLSSIGSNFSSSLKSVSSNFTTVNSNLNSAVRNLNSSIPNLNNFGGDIAKIANTIDSSIAGPLSNINNFTSSITGEVDKVVNNFSNQLLTNNKQIVDSLGRVQNILGEVASITVNTGNLSDSIGSSLSAGLPKIGGQLNSFSNQAQSAINNITGVTSAVSSTLNGAVGNINQSLLNTNIPVFQKAAGNLTSGFNNIQSSVNQNITGITSKVNNVVSTVDSVSNLLSNPQQLTSALNNTLNNLVQSGLNSLLGPISSIFNTVNDFSQNLNITPGNLNNLVGNSVGGLFNYIDNTSAAFQSNLNSASNASAVPAAVATTGFNGSTKLKNVLRDYNTYNYIVTMGVLDHAEMNDPSLYRGRGTFKYNLLKSGGGEYENKVTISEESPPEYLEYFIDDLEIDSVLAPNPNTGLALGTTISFKVTEPYSMGKFLETMVAGAAQAGYQNHLKAYYCLRIGFIGWDEYGAEIRNDFAVPRYIPMAITNMQFQVTGAGCTYDVEAVVTSDLATEDRVNKTLTTLETSGKSPHELLLTADNSVTNSLNALMEQAEKNEIVASEFDRFLICFPPNHDSLHQAVKNRISGSTTELTENIAGGVALGVNRGIQVSEAQQLDAFGGPGAPINGMYKFLRSWAFDNVNEIGESEFVSDIADGTDANANRPLAVWSIEKQLYDRSQEPANTTQARSVKFHADTAITDLITETVKNAKVIRDAPDEDNGDGRKLYFRIETSVFTEKNNAAEREFGRHPRVYVYAVHPYYYDEAKIAGTGEVGNSAALFKEQAAKEYNYYYTGKNEDVLNFDINFNFAYFQAVKGDIGNSRTDLSGQTAKTTDSPSAEKNPSKQSGASATNDLEGAKFLGFTPRHEFFTLGGKRRDLTTSAKMEITEYVHNAIVNSPVDMITANMEIWGDPYYLPTDLGNYAAPQRSKLINSELGMPSVREEIWCNINFKTPLDYPVNGFVMDFPELSRPFHGIYHIWAATNKFSGGKFTQELKLIRKNFDDRTGTTGNSGISAKGRGLASDTNTINPNMVVTQSDVDNAFSNNSGVGFGNAQVDPGLAQGQLLQTGSFENNGVQSVILTDGSIVTGNRPPVRRPGSSTGPF